MRLVSGALVSWAWCARRRAGAGVRAKRPISAGPGRQRRTGLSERSRPPAAPKTLGRHLGHRRQHLRQPVPVRRKIDIGIDQSLRLDKGQAKLPDYNPPHGNPQAQRTWMDTAVPAGALTSSQPPGLT